MKDDCREEFKNIDSSIEKILIENCTNIYRV